MGADEGAPDYTDSYRVRRPGAAERSPEEWMRAALERAPWPLRTFIRVGWRAVLGFQLGPSGSVLHVLGWPIVGSGPEEVVLHQRSALIDARLRLRVSDDEIEWATWVRYEHTAARIVWAGVGPIHRRIVPYVLRRAVAQAPPVGPGRPGTEPRRSR